MLSDRGMSHRPDRMDAETLRELLAENRAILVDARPNLDYERATEQIPSARHVDPGGGSVIDHLLFSLPREKTLVVYCDQPEQAASAAVARRARELGIGDASILDGGFAAWKAAGYATERRPMASGEAIPFNL